MSTLILIGEIWVESKKEKGKTKSGPVLVPGVFELANTVDLCYCLNYSKGPDVVDEDEVAPHLQTCLREKDVTGSVHHHYFMSCLMLCSMLCWPAPM